MIAAFDVLSDDPHFGRRFYRQALAASLLLRPIGNTVYFMPPVRPQRRRVRLPRRNARRPRWTAALPR
jgi:adenosylmethionine-8-amino-7-oxononanoate aminotransferase